MLVGLKERLVKEGMEKSLCLGYVCDSGLAPAEAKVFAGILGNDVQWIRCGHAAGGSLERAEPLPGGGHVGLHFFTYLPPLPDPRTAVPTFSTVRWPRVAYFRMFTTVQKPLPSYRAFPAWSHLIRLPGFGSWVWTTGMWRENRLMGTIMRTVSGAAGRTQTAILVCRLPAISLGSDPTGPSRRPFSRP